MTPLNALRYTVTAAFMLTATHAYDELVIPSLDFRTLAYNNTVASELQKYGIITISDVPGYADLRREYLHAAAECAWQRPSEDPSRGILYRELNDGTKRFTISSTNGVDHLDWDACPKYQRIKHKFSELVAKVIDGFSAAFDASFTAVGQSSSLREFVSDARDMDHFHAYVPVQEKKRTEEMSSSAAATAATASAQEPLESNSDPEEKFALSMHSDLGLFIAMSAPAFFQVSLQNASVLQEIPNPDKTSGLTIKLRDGTTVVHPVQKDDELTMMVGDGFSTWVQLPVEIPAVVHGMRMPQTRHEKSQVIRAWYGKMVLLSESATMLNSGMEFAAYSRQLGEFVESGSSFPSQFASVACPAHRQLMSNACNYRLCHPFSLSTTKEQCDFWCNTHSMAIDFAALCQSNCACQHHAVSENTFECWMSCFEKSDECKGVEWCTEKILSDQNPIAVRSCDGANTMTKTTKHLRAKVKAFRVTVVREESDSSGDESSDSAN